MKLSRTIELLLQFFLTFITLQVLIMLQSIFNKKLFLIISKVFNKYFIKKLRGCS